MTEWTCVCEKYYHHFLFVKKSVKVFTDYSFMTFLPPILLSKKVYGFFQKQKLLYKMYICVGNEKS